MGGLGDSGRLAGRGSDILSCRPNTGRQRARDHAPRSWRHREGAYAVLERGQAGAFTAATPLTALAFTGGCLAPVALLTRCLWRPRVSAGSVHPSLRAALLVAALAACRGPAAAPSADGGRRAPPLAAAACVPVSDDRATPLASWSWSYPLPQGDAIGALFGVAPDDVWAGASGMLLHWNGVKWTPWAAPLTAYTAIWGASSCDVWAVGAHGVIAHFDGRRWTEERSGVHVLLTSVFGTSTDDVWIGGDEGTLLHREGNSFRAAEIPAIPINGLHGTDANHLVAVGSHGLMLSGNGRHWLQQDSGVKADITAVRFSSPTEAFATLDVGGLMHWDGEAWRVLRQPEEPIELWRFAKEPSMPRPAPRTRPLAVTPDGEAFLFEEAGGGQHNGRLLRCRRDGRCDSIAAPINSVSAAFAFGPRDVWLGDSGGGLFRFDGARFAGQHMGDLYRRRTTAMGGTSDSDLWAIGYGGDIRHFDGQQWSAVSLPESIPTLNPQEAIWASGPHDIWIGGCGPEHALSPSVTQCDKGLLHGDGLSWRWVRAPINSVQALWGTGPDDVWAASRGIAHWNGKNWRRVPGAQNQEVNSIAGVAQDDAWAVTNKGHALHWNGRRWQDGGELSVFPLRAVWVGAPDDAWAVGDYQQAYHWNGRTWSRVEVPAYELHAIGGRSGGDLYAVGAPGAAIHFDGHSWTAVPSLWTCSAVRPMTSGEVWFGCDEGVLRYRPQ